MTSDSQGYSTKFTRLLEQLASALDELSIRYMIIGGQAVLVYGEPRLTKDIDVTLALDSNGLTSLMPVVDKLKLTVLVEQPQEFVKRTSVLPVRDIGTGIRIDFVFSFTPYERQAIGHARKVRLGEVDVTFATLEDVIVHKIFSGRPRDIEDVRSIVRKSREHDRNYVLKWLKTFDESLKSNGLETYVHILSEETPDKKID